MKSLVVAPHPDDELLGPGGTLIRRGTEGVTVGWLLVTSIKGNPRYDPRKVEEREQEIQRVRKGLGIKKENQFLLGFPTAKLDQVPMGELVERISEVFQSFEPNEILVPHAHDVHSDHRIVFEAVAACSKWFRYPSVKRILAYETLSETDCILDNRHNFKPNVFTDITPYLKKKIRLLGYYQSEWCGFPFPRSETAIRALAKVRGAESGYQAAEAFLLLRERS